MLLTGGSAFGLAAADGVGALARGARARLHDPVGLVPLVPAAVIYDLADRRSDGAARARGGLRGLRGGRAGVPERGRVGAGTGAAVGKILGRERATPGGVGYAALRTGPGDTVAALAVVNAVGDVIGEDGSVLAGPAGDDGETAARRRR